MLPRPMRIIYQHRYIRLSFLAKKLGKEPVETHNWLRLLRKQGYEIIRGERGYTMKPTREDRVYDARCRAQCAAGCMINGASNMGKCYQIAREEIMLILKEYQNSLKMLTKEIEFFSRIKTPLLK